MKKLIGAIALILIVVGFLGVFAFTKFYKTTRQQDPPTNIADKPSVQNKKIFTGLPNDVLPEQIEDIYGVFEIENNLYVFALESNVNYPLSSLRLRGEKIAWHGVLRSQDNGKTWVKFFTIVNPAYPSSYGSSYSGQKMSYNAVGMFAEGKTIYVDIANTHGAGSGEGQMIRFSTNDGGATWKQEACFYFIPENYYRMNNDQLDLQNIDPYKLNTQAGCVY